MTGFHVGQNMPGYLPESDVDHCDTWESAVEAMAWRLDHLADSEESWADEHDCDDIPCPTYGDTCPWQNAQAIRLLIEELREEKDHTGWDGWSNNLHHWIAPCTEDGCEEDNE